MARQCVSCKLESNFEEAFHQGRKSKKFYCPICWEKRRRSDERGEILGGLLIFGLCLAAPFSPIPIPGAWLLFNLIIVLLWTSVLAIPHELGHAIVGRFVGLRIFGIVVGSGKRLFQLKVFGIRFEARIFPAGGLTFGGYRHLQFFRSHRFLFVLAGPAIEVALLLALFIIIPPDKLFSTEYFMPAKPQIIGTLVAAIGLSVALSLLPFKYRYDGIPVESDGLILLKTPFMSATSTQATHAFYFFQEAQACHEDKHYEPALDWCRKGLAFYPDNVALRIQLGYALYYLKQFVDARRTWLEALDRSDIDTQSKLYTCYDIAAADILIHGSIPDTAPARPPELPTNADLLREALALSAEAFEMAPWIVHFKSMRGCVLIEEGRAEEGLFLLREAMKELEGEEKAFCACYVAQGQFMIREIEEANESVAAARKLDPQCFALEIATKRISLSESIS